MRLITSGLAAAFFLAIAGATPITFTFTGTASGDVSGTSFTGDAFTISFFTDTTNVCQIGNMVYSNCPQMGDIGDWTTPNPTDNSFTLGSYSGELTGLSALIGPAVFLNANTNNVGVWFFNTSDWLATASPDFTSSFGLVNNLSVTNVLAFGNTQLSSSAMNSTVGSIDFSSVSNVSFTATLGTPSNMTGTAGATGPSGTSSAPSGPTSVTTAQGVIPEPSTLTMFAIGVLGVTLGKLRRRRA